MSASPADRNLLFGILALQLDLVHRDHLVEAMHAWVLQKHRPLADILVEKGFLAERDRELLDPMVDRHIEAHNGDAAKSLHSLSSVESIQRALSVIADPDVEQSMAHLCDSPPQIGSLEPTADVSNTALGLPERFRLLRFHARGGLGQISVALDNELHREVALKEIQPQCADDPEKRARFLQEAEITGNLEHPGVVPVYGLGRYADGRPFYAMRFVRGQSLREAIERFHAPKHEGRSTHPSAVAFHDLLGRFVDVCNAIEYAHSRGVLHRDLKPGNIMLGKYGETLVVDWGLAKVIHRPETLRNDGDPTIQPHADSGSAPTQMGSAVGTPAYMSPEQASGRLDLLGPASDIYSLGATLYSLLTGQPPFSSRDPDILRKVERGEFRRPRLVRPSVPRALEAICLKAMARNPSDRYASAKALATDIERWMADEPVTACPDPWITRLRRAFKRHPVAAAVSTTALVILCLVFTGMGIWRWRRIDILRRQVEGALLAAVDGAHAGAFDQAVTGLSRAAGLIEREPALASLNRQVIQRLGQLENHRNFLRRSREALDEGFHVLRVAEGPDAIVLRAEQALAIYGGPDQSQWSNVFAGLPLTEEQIAETKSYVSQLMDLIALRTAMYDTADDAGRRATERALHLLERADALREPTLGIWMARMLFHRRLGHDREADEARNAMTQAAISGETSARDDYLLGVLSHKILNDPSKAIAMLQRAVAKEPHNFGAQFALFAAARDAKDPQVQLQALTACLALRPDTAELHYFRGFAYFEQGRYALAQHDFDACVIIDPNFALGHYWRARTLIMSDQWEEAASALERAIAADADLRAAYSWRAVARAKLGQCAGASADVEFVLESQPDPSERWRCARALALCAARVQATNAEVMTAEQFAERSVQVLADLADEDYFTPDENLTSLLSSDLDALRDRAAFLQLTDRLVEPLVQQPELAKSSYLLLLRVLVMARRDQRESAVQDARRILQRAQLVERLRPELAADEYYVAAESFAVCAMDAPSSKEVAPSPAAPDPATKTGSDPLRSECRARALEALRKAVQLGFDDAERMANDPRLRAIRDEPEYAALLNEVRGRGNEKQLLLETLKGSVDL